MDSGILDLSADNAAQLSLNLTVNSCILNAVFTHIASLSSGLPQRRGSLSGNLHHCVSLNHIIFLEIVELLKYKAALVT